MPSDERAFVEAHARQAAEYAEVKEAGEFFKEELKIIRDSLTVSLCLLETGCVYLRASDAAMATAEMMARSGAKRRGPTEDQKPLVAKLEKLLAKVEALLA